MKILVLSCSTGGGHNACGHYIEKEFKYTLDKPEKVYLLVHLTKIL